MDERETTFTRQARRVLTEGRPEEAVSILDSWLRLTPDDAGGWEVIRDAHVELGHPFEAEHAARQLARLRPENAEAWYRLGALLRTADKPDEARQALHHALSIDPAFEVAREELERIAPSPQQPQEPPPKRKRRASTSAPRARAKAAPTSVPPLERRRSADGWKVRSPGGKMYGPYSEDQLAEYLLQGTIGQEWDARFGSGRITKVRDALGPARTDDLLRQMRKRPASAVAEQQAHPEEKARIAHVDEDTPTCPNCGGRTVTSEERSANAARIGVIVLGFFFLPIWLLLLVLKDRIRYTCLTCGTQWDENA